MRASFQATSLPEHSHELHFPLTLYIPSSNTIPPLARSDSATAPVFAAARAATLDHPPGVADPPATAARLVREGA